MSRLQKIDDLSLDQHCRLGSEDECYFLLSYTAHRSYDYNEENDLIFNLKKSLEKKDRKEWQYKVWAINRCSKYLNEVNLFEALSPSITFVPIPPSKCKNDPLYDDRLIQILSQVAGEVDIRELILQKESQESAHSSPKKRNISSIIDNYIVDETLIEGVKDTIVIFDDVLTTGAHYKAAKTILGRHFPDKHIIGLFIARRVFPDD